MEKMYSRNRIYIKPDEQEKIKHFRVLLGGAGIGSIIAECALRMGFETITIIDGDKVEKSNLNRQNYRLEDVGNYRQRASPRYYFPLIHKRKSRSSISLLTMIM